MSYIEEEERALMEQVRKGGVSDVRAHLVYADWLMEYGDEERGEFIQWQVELYRIWYEPGYARRLLDPSDRVELAKGHIKRLLGIKHGDEGINFRRWAEPVPSLALGMWSDRRRNARVDVDYLMGFVRWLKCPYDWWDDFGHQVMEAHPLREVLFNDKPGLGELSGVMAYHRVEATEHPEINFFVVMGDSHNVPVLAYGAKEDDEQEDDTGEDSDY